MAMSSMSSMDTARTMRAEVMKVAEEQTHNSVTPESEAGHVAEAGTVITYGGRIELVPTSAQDDGTDTLCAHKHARVDDDETESEDEYYRTSKVIRQKHPTEAIREVEDEAQQKLTEEIEQFIQSVMRCDPFIIDSAKQLGIPNDKALLVDDRNGTVLFVLCDSMYKDWREAHEKHIRTKFTQTKAPYTLKSGLKVGWSRHEHMCHRGKLPTLHPERVKVLYMFRHNHPLGQNNGVSIRRLSPEMRDQIKALAQSGLSVQAIHSQVNSEMKAQRSAMLWDDHVYYMDVYNIVYKATSNKARKIC
ncbi:hypothetical protein BGZ73_007959 [Actinomortierella ambigua]|nr:hypothetical protein BGZ73_007959 [Actinomortierella ambigua]